jgi:hypothetical protein
MDPVTIGVLGGCGGALVQVVDFCSKLTAWQQARHDALASRGLLKPPLLSEIVDPLSDALVLLSRLVLGAAAGLLFHTQVSGLTAAVAIGAAAPALLRQFGELRLASGAEITVGPAGTKSRPGVSMKAAEHPDSVPKVPEIAGAGVIECVTRGETVENC